MLIRDSIYGILTITNPLIIDLINSKPFQRLKKISQDGARHYLYPERQVTRYDHSVGTWHLSYRYKRPLEEQVASLLHDLPHTAFSHVIDFVVSNENHEYHDQFLKEVIVNSEIPAILKKHNLDLKKVLHKEAFYLLDNKLPDLSVDRIDYFLRDGYAFQLLPKETVNLFLNSLKEKHQRFYFEEVNIASLFAVMFVTCSRLYWLGPDSHGAFFMLAEAIKLALKKNYITEKDFFQTDDVLFTKLKHTKDKQILALLNRLKPGTTFRYAPKEEAEFFGPNKPRFVDPLVLVDKKLQTLSTIIPGMNEYFEDFAKRYKYLGVKQSTAGSYAVRGTR